MSLPASNTTADFDAVSATFTTYAVRWRRGVPWSPARIAPISGDDSGYEFVLVQSEAQQIECEVRAFRTTRVDEHLTLRRERRVLDGDGNTVLERGRRFAGFVRVRYDWHASLPGIADAVQERYSLLSFGTRRQIAAVANKAVLGGVGGLGKLASGEVFRFSVTRTGDARQERSTVIAVACIALYARWPGLNETL